MFRKTTIALAAGMAAAQCAGKSGAMITIHSMNYSVDFQYRSTSQWPFPFSIDGTSADGIVHRTIDQYPISAFIKTNVGGNTFSGNIAVTGHLNFEGGAYAFAGVEVLIDFTTDVPLVWSYTHVPDTFINNMPLAFIDYRFPSELNPIMPGRHTFLATVQVWGDSYFSGGPGGNGPDSYTSLWFGVPAPSTAINLLGVGLIASARRRRVP